MMMIEVAMCLIDTICSDAYVGAGGAVAQQGISR
jgi:hypothetical protein